MTGCFIRIHDDQTKRTSGCSWTWIFWNDTLVCTWNVLYYNPSLPNTLWASVSFFGGGSQWHASQGVWQSLGNLMRSFSWDTCCMPMMHLSLRTFGFNNTSLIRWLLSNRFYTFRGEFIVRSRDLFKASLKSMQWLLLRNGRSDFQHHAFTGRANSSWSQFHAGTVGDD